MTSLKKLDEMIQRCQDGEIKNVLCEIAEILGWFYTWLEEISKEN